MKERQFKVGDRIQITQGSEHWVDDMDQYVGREATITKVEEGYFVDRIYRIDIDKGEWKWVAEAGHFIHAPQKGIDQKDELLHRAKQMFPVGTKFCPAHQTDEDEIKEKTHCIITDDTSLKFDDAGNILAMVGSSRWFNSHMKEYGNTSYDRLVYWAIQKKWAYVYPAKEEPIPASALLLIEAKKRYPIGTKYKSATDGREEFTVTEQLFTVVNNDIIHGELCKGCLYVNGEWAEIVTEESHKFKVGDWVIGTCPPYSPYAITCKGWIGKVVGLNADGTMDVNSDASISIYRNVQPEYFEHHKTESVFSSDYLQQQMDKVSASIDLSHEKLRVYSSGSIGLSIPVVQPQMKVKKVSFNRI